MSAHSPSSATAIRCSASLPLPTRSALVATATTGVAVRPWPSRAICSAMYLSPGPTRWSAGTQKAITSTSARVCSTRSLSRSPSSVRGLCSPGVSTRTSWASVRCTTPRMTCRVVCGRPEVDVIAFCLPADQRVGPGDRYIAEQIARLGQGRTATPVVAVATKADLVGKGRLAEHLMAVAELGEWADIVPVSAVDGYQVDTLLDVLLGHLPTGPPLYPDGELTDEPELVMVAELVREAVLEGVRDELPHSLAVVVDEISVREGRDADRPLLDVRVNLFVERDSQKAIVIGKGGARLREVGTQARRGIEALLGARVYLDLHVKVAKDWQRDPKQLGRLGF